MYNPMIMQASYAMYSLVAHCKGENEEDLQQIIFPVAGPLVPEDPDIDMLMAGGHAGRAVDLGGMLGSLLGGATTFIDVRQLLATIETVSNVPQLYDSKHEASSDDVDGITDSSDRSNILGPLPLTSCKPSFQTSKRSRSQFAFNHVLAASFQAQLLEIITMPVVDEPVPLEARLPIASMGEVISLFDLPLIRPLIAKSSTKPATEHSAASSEQTSTLSAPVAAPVAVTGESILGRPPVPRFPGPRTNVSAPMAPGAVSGNIRLVRNAAVRPLAGRNFAGTGPRPGPRGNMRPVVRSPQQWKPHDNDQSGAGWQWNSNQWDSGAQSYSGPPVPAGGTVRHRPPHRPPGSQSGLPNVRGRPPQVC